MNNIKIRKISFAISLIAIYLIITLAITENISYWKDFEDNWWCWLIFILLSQLTLLQIFKTQEISIFHSIRNGYKSKKYLIKRIIYYVLAAIVIIAISFFAYKHIENQPKLMNEFLNVSLDDNKEDVIFSKGKPSSIEDEIYWMYDGFYIGFNKENKIRFILHFDEKKYLNMQGIYIGDDREKVEEKFGKCDSISVSPDKLQRLYKYPSYNVFFTLQQNKVTEFGIYNPKYVFAFKNVVLKNEAELSGATENVISISISPDNKYIAGGTDQKALFDDTGKFDILIWDTKNNKEFTRLRGHNSSIQAVTFSQNGELLASCDSRGDVKIWNTNTWNLLHNFSNNDWMDELVFTTDNKFLIGSERFNKNLKVWSANDGVLSYKINLGQQIDAFDLQRTNDLIVACCYKELQIWSLKEKKKIYSKMFDESLFSACFNNDGSKFIIGNRIGEVLLFETGSKKLVKKVSAHTMPVLSLAFNNSDEYIITCSSDKTIKLLNANDLSVVDSLSNPHSGNVNKVKFFADKEENKFLSCGDDNLVRVWEIIDN
ncbi:MAG: hypothetical protein D8M52_05615 [Chlorobi bacterium]|nr:hypothetical protein [Ignavibacteriota bacterium]MBL1161180.1 hypothetical protein [Chlorobiota bacterium]MBW7869278.1 hypothetical protein [Brumimicrobium sp.]MCO6446257.1 hypothetical protein [Ignavibacterium album]MCZ2269012.1 hypothetical protein [Ignavibacteriales bacterium]HOJ06165.1 hypothetical protein [Ignavibacteriaceae bacterium]